MTHCKDVRRRATVDTATRYVRATLILITGHWIEIDVGRQHANFRQRLVTR